MKYLHTMIRVSNLEQSLDFFINKLGFVEQRRYENENGRFTLVFMALGATATVLGRLFHQEREWVGRVGGVLVIVLGLYLLGVFNFGVFAKERRVHVANKPSRWKCPSSPSICA